MIALSKRKKSKIDDSVFISMLPAICRFARHKFRSADRTVREELVQETVCNAFKAFRRLVELGKQDLVYPTPLARFAVKQVRAGRRIAGKLRPSDVTSEQAQRQQGFRVGPLETYDATERQWREILVEDGRATPADIAASRIDFAGWLKLLNKRERKIALTLAGGETTSAAAKQFAVSSARISQLRAWLQQSWQKFQGEFTEGKTAMS